MNYSTLAALVLGAALVVGSVHARQQSIAGAWTLSIEHLGLKLVLEEKKSIVTGTLDWPPRGTWKAAPREPDTPAR